MQILRADERWVIVDKPSGLSVHKGWDASDDHVMSRLKAALGRWVYPVHRLDRATSGALVMALDSECASRLSESFRDGLVDKEYVALVRGVVRAPGTVDYAVPRSEGSEERVEARTDYAPLGTARDRYTLVHLRPHTGRLHQIRRHMRHLRCPLLGDTTYGDNKENKKLRAEVGLHRLALHALRLALPHPERDGRIEARAPLPPDLREPLERLGFSPALLDAIDAGDFEGAPSSAASSSAAPPVATSAGAASADAASADAASADAASADEKAPSDDAQGTGST